MPTYHYRCPKCEFEFEEFQSIKDEPLSTCPNCKARPERVISGGAGLLFKGGGFYITDHRSEGYKQDARKDAPKESKPSDSKSGDKSSTSGGSSSSGS